MKYKIVTLAVFLTLLLSQLAVFQFAAPEVKASPATLYEYYNTGDDDWEVRGNPITYELTPSIVGTSNHSLATGGGMRRAFYVNGRFWVFYVEDSNLVYKTSTDGVNWSAATIIRPVVSSNAPVCDVFYDGTYFYYIHTSCDFNIKTIYFRRGVLNADGTITWSAGEQSFDPSVEDWVTCDTVRPDSNGYPFIGVGSDTGEGCSKFSKNDGTKGAVTTTWFVTGSAVWDRPAHIVRLTGGKMYAFYYNGAYLMGKLWSGSAWGEEEQVSSDAIVSPTTWNSMCNAISIGDDVHVVWLSSARNIVYRKRTCGTGWGSEVTVQSSVTTTSKPVLAVDTATNNLYCFWAAADHIYYKKCVAGTWDASPTDWIDETTDHLTGYDRLSCFYQAYGGYIGLVYMTNTTSPYKVKFAYLQLVVADTTPPTYSDVGTNTTRAGASCQFSVLWNDNVNVSGYIFGTNNTGTWVNETWTPFTVYYNSTAAWSNVTKTLTSSVGIVVAWQVWANDTSNNWSTTGLQYLTTTVPFPFLRIEDWELNNWLKSQNRPYILTSTYLISSLSYSPIQLTFTINAENLNTVEIRSYSTPLAILINGYNYPNPTHSKEEFDILGGNGWYQSDDTLYIKSYGNCTIQALWSGYYPPNELPPITPPSHGVYDVKITAPQIVDTILHTSFTAQINIINPTPIAGDVQLTWRFLDSQNNIILYGSEIVFVEANSNRTVAIDISFARFTEGLYRLEAQITSPMTTPTTTQTIQLVRPARTYLTILLGIVFIVAVVYVLKRKR